MQIDTHIMDFINDTFGTDNGDKFLTKSLIQGRSFEKSCSTVPKSWKLSVLTVITFDVGARYRFNNVVNTQ